MLPPPGSEGRYFLGPTLGGGAEGLDWADRRGWGWLGKITCSLSLIPAIWAPVIQVPRPPTSAPSAQRGH